MITFFWVERRVDRLQEANVSEKLFVSVFSEVIHLQ
jgi:hypothetical protein